MTHTDLRAPSAPTPWLAQVLFCARIAPDGRLEPVEGMAAKLTAAVRNTLAPLVRHVVVSADQPGLNGDSVRMEGARSLPLIRAQTLHEAMDSLQRAYRLDEFTGQVRRAWAEEALCRAVKARDRGYLVLIGKAGAGKTALLRRLLSEGALEADGSCWVPATHFVRGSGQRDTPTVFIAELIARLRAAIAGSDEAHMDEAQEFETVLDRAAAVATGYGKRCVIVVDGVDEAFGRGRRSAGEFGRFFPRADRLPKGLVILLSSRPDEDYLLEDLAGPEVSRLDLSRHADACNADISALLRQRANRLAPDRHERLVARLAGNFALTRCLLEEARDQPDALERWAADPAAFPASIDEWLERQWLMMERAALGKGVSPDSLLAVLGLIVLAARDLTRIELANVLGTLGLPRSPLPKLPSPLEDSPLRGCLEEVDLTTVLELVSPIISASGKSAHRRETDGLRLVNIAFDDWIEQRLDARRWRRALHQVLAWACAFHSDGRFAALHDYALHALGFHLIFAGHARLACTVLHGRQSAYAGLRACAARRLLADTGSSESDAADRLHRLAEWAMHDDYLVQALEQELAQRRERLASATGKPSGKAHKRLEKTGAKLARARAGAAASQQHLAYFIHEHGYRVVDVARSSGYCLPTAAPVTTAAPPEELPSPAQPA